MTKEDYEKIATQLEMYCSPDSFPGPVYSTINGKFELDKLETERVKGFFKGQLDMLNRCKRFLKSYHDNLETIEKLAKKL